jgi:hypothetical protein
MTELTDRQDPIQLSPFPFQLIDIRLFEVRMERPGSSEEAPDEVPLSVHLHSGDEPPNAEEIHLLLTFETLILSDEGPQCSVYLALEGLFQAIVDIDTLRPETLHQFKARDAVLLLWPYLRQTLHDLGERMRLGLAPLPIIDARALVQQTSTEGIAETD